MTKEQIQKHLTALFTTVKIKDTDESRICFADEYLGAPNGSEELTIQRIVSSVMSESGLTFDFSYDIASSACDILAEADSFTESDDWREAIDSQVPIYYHDIQKIYQGNYGAVDEYRDDIGGGNIPSDCMRDAQGAWYTLIERMATQITEKLNELIESDEATEEREATNPDKV